MVPDISVIIPTFRRPKELREAVESALAQQGVTVEVIVVDDSPEGSGAAVIKDVGDARVTYKQMPAPSGGKPSMVRNFGWPDATGALCHFLDDDDVVPVGHYARMKSTFASHPEVGVVFGVVAPFSSSHFPLEHELDFFAQAARRARVAQRFGTRIGFSGYQFFDATMTVCSCTMLRRECLSPLNGFDNGLRLMEDVDFAARAMRQFGAYFLDEVTLHYRIGPSLMHSRTTDEGIVTSYKRIHANYREKWGHADFLALKVFARTALRAAL